MIVKKILITILFLNVSAASAAFELSCPDGRDEIDTSSKSQWCESPRSYELFGKNEGFKAENEVFDEILTDAFLDNRSDPEFIVRKLVRELRIHRECLNNICIQIMTACGKNSGAETNFLQNSWCDEKVQNLMEFEETKIEVIATKNQTRKERSLLWEKFVAIAKRFKTYLHMKLLNVTMKFENVARKLEEAFYVYVKHPITKK